MTDSPDQAETSLVDIDRRWAALEVGLADLESPDFDASLFDDGPGPWIVLKGSQSDGPDPDDVFTVPASLERIVRGLESVHAVHETADDWLSDDRARDPRPHERRVSVFFSETSAIYTTMQTEEPVLNSGFSSKSEIESVAIALLTIITDRLENRSAVASGP
ncbi:glycerol-3-phosphate transporter ATP-binding subunit [Methylorubrum populi]|uniref:Glycerol-3-phosphate transporter ATP-binding subunit n=1 Tax=Methylorubrum populi TaxID=223967 RepID=A0A160PFM4_9HYPH|nr:hypothetical protein [Methylorubrum populi]BAU90531.1 glycerol-3-phosphate transporter ATP-binding subunit [Methylorubrum populi]